MSRLEFQLPNARLPAKAGAVAQFRIISSGEGGDRCAPCSVFLEMFPGELAGYSLEEYAAFEPEFTAALSRAHQRVLARLAANIVVPK